MRGMKWAAGAVAGVVLAAGAADAAVITATSTGVLASGYDEFGYLGVAGDLTGRTFTLTATYDTAFAVFTDNGTSTTLVGGDPGVGDLTILTIGGITAMAGAGHTATDYASDGELSQTWDASGSVGGDSQTITTTAFVTGSGFSTSVLTPTAGNLCLLGLCGGSFQLLATSGGSTVINAYGTFAPTSYTITIDNGSIFNPGEGTGVPEPATWAFMILGFGAAGAALRRRRAAFG